MRCAGTNFLMMVSAPDTMRNLTNSRTLSKLQFFFFNETKLYFRWEIVNFWLFLLCLFQQSLSGPSGILNLITQELVASHYNVFLWDQQLADCIAFTECTFVNIRFGKLELLFVFFRFCIAPKFSKVQELPLDNIFNNKFELSKEIVKSIKS